MALIVSYSGMAFCPACILLVYSWGERVGKAKIISYSLPSNNNETKLNMFRLSNFEPKLINIAPQLSTKGYSMIPQMTKAHQMEEEHNI